MKPNIEKLLQLPNVWQARQSPNTSASISTGFTELDKALHLQGWPLGATTELLQSQPGFGELPLLLPTLKQRQQAGYWQIMIDPPFTPFAPALQAQGIELNRLLLIYPKNLKDLLWSAAHCLQSGHCTSVLTWNHRAALRDRDLRRLQQAAVSGQCWHVLMRSAHTKNQASPSALRIALVPDSHGFLNLDILKQRGGWSGQQIQVRNAPSFRKESQQHRKVHLAPLPEHPQQPMDDAQAEPHQFPKSGVQTLQSLRTNRHGEYGHGK